MARDPAIEKARQLLKDRDLRGAVAVYEQRITDLEGVTASPGIQKGVSATILGAAVIVSLLAGALIMAGIFALLPDSEAEADTANLLATQHVEATAAVVAQAKATLEWLNIQEQIYVSSALQTYCSSVAGRTKGDCERWADVVIDGNYAGAKACYDEYDWIVDRDTFSICLLAQGIAVLGDEALITPLDPESMSDQDMRLQGALIVRCGDSRSDDYCRVWAILTYMKQSESVKECNAVLSCLERQGITLDDVR